MRLPQQPGRSENAAVSGFLLQRFIDSPLSLSPLRSLAANPRRVVHLPGIERASLLSTHGLSLHAVSCIRRPAGLRAPWPFVQTQTSALQGGKGVGRMKTRHLYPD